MIQSFPQVYKSRKPISNFYFSKVIFQEIVGLLEDQ